MGICYIIGAGECPCLDFKKEKDDLIIAADGGYMHLLSANIVPDILIGDFDSLGCLPDFKNIIKLNPVKDITDTHAAINIGIENGYDDFVIYGALGGRIDHSLANIQLIASLSQKNIKTEIRSGKTVMTAITNSSIRFNSSYKGYISVFSHTEKCEGVCLRGLKYPLENATLTNSFPLGVSNEFIGDDSKIIITKGTAIIVYSAPGA